MAVMRKREARRSVRQVAWLTLEGGFAARGCEVVNLSSTGAKIMVDDPSVLSSKMKLGFTRDGVSARPCEVVWRRGKTLGLRFTA